MNLQQLQQVCLRDGQRITKLCDEKEKLQQEIDKLKGIEKLWILYETDSTNRFERMLGFVTNEIEANNLCGMLNDGNKEEPFNYAPASRFCFDEIVKA